MYRIDRSTNRISELETRRFSDLGFTERKHLQEWLAHNPGALKEDLLIIQKEFDGFDETRERLDLLALDKEGNLVVIENKLDDSGRDVVWQALKYASYCSNLTKAQIIEMFQGYLGAGGDAQTLLCEFFDVSDMGDVVINRGNNQRIMFVAANFRKEVTSTALWLLTHGIQMQCFKVTPYAMAEELFMTVEQIIPTPEAQELMIGMAAKEAEEKSSQVELKARHHLRLDFWERALEVLRESACDLFNNISPTKDHWVSAGSGLSGVAYQLIFGSRVMRVQLSIARSVTEENKIVFDQLFSEKEAIEGAFGAPLTWERLDDKKSSRIAFSKEVTGFNRDNWPEMITWLSEHMSRFEKALKAPLGKVSRTFKSA